MKVDKKEPLVSICMPAYNSEKFIENAILSIHDQSYKNYELIIVDDGSIDSTSAVAKNLIKSLNIDGRVRAIKNSGPEAARDIGFSLAKGELFAALDSDDLWEKEYLNKLVSMMLRYQNVGIAFSDFLIFYEKEAYSIKKSETIDFFNPDKAPYGEDNFYIFYPDEFFPILIQGMLLFPSCTIFKKSVYNRAGPYTLNFNLPVSCDWDFALRASMVAPTLYIDQALVRRRFHEDNISIDGIETAKSDVKVIKNMLSKYSLSKYERYLSRKRLSARMFNIGYSYFHNNNIKSARKWIRKSFRVKPRKDNFKYLVLSAFNYSFYSTLIKFKRRLKK